jgi:outer membrane protein OmpA-like peptidoglycan-associated protein/uncharacterized protein YidB (DUF937 family)
MFESIIREAASKFGLGDKAGPLVQMLLAYITNKDTGGIGGFMSKLSGAGLGDIAKSWLGGGAGAQAVSGSQIESLFGGQGGLLGSLTSKLGLGGSTITSALGFILPAVIGKLTPGGSIPTSLPSEVMGFMSGGKDLLSGGAAAAGRTAAHVADAGKAASGGLMKWLPWIVGLGAIALALGYCSKTGDVGKPAAVAPPKVEMPKVEAPKVEAPVPPPAAPAVAEPPKVADAAPAAPAGSGVVAWMLEGVPALKVYFDTGKVDVASEFADKSKAMVDYLKANASAKAVVSGFNDPTGNAAANAELSKKRAQGVAAAIKAAGIAEDRVVLEKPADTTTGAAMSNAEARRVEVTIRK